MLSTRDITICVFFLGAVIYYYANKKPHITQRVNIKYDYVIVGGGTAGCVLASRLSEDPSTTVLLIEAGDEETKHPAVDVPLRAAETYGSHVDWNYLSVPQTHACKGRKNQRCPLPKGKVLGGSSSINDMVYMRGEADSLDWWEQQHGCEGWGFQAALPFYKMAEGVQDKGLVDTGLHGDTGPMVITERPMTELADTFLEAGQEVGLGEEQLSVSPVMAHVSSGARVGTARAYLRPAMARPNLHVATQARVLKIIFYKKKAIGLEYIRNGTRKQVGAGREVILSAGAIETPHLLLLSGVGPRKHLEQMGIPVVADLPVGEGLFDQMVVRDAVRFTLEQPLGLTLQKAYTISSQLQYWLFGNGYLGSPMAAEAYAMFRPPDQPASGKRHTIGLLSISNIQGHYALANEELMESLYLEEMVFDELYSDLDNTEGTDIAIYLFQPASRGTVRLASRDAMDKPLVDPNFLEIPADVQAFIKGVRVAQKLGNTTAFRSKGAVPLVRKHPSCSVYEYGSDAYWDCFLRHHAGALHQEGGTCKMGKLADNTTVVDLDLRVKGLEGVRVVDASVMPSPVSGALAITIVMMAEKTAAQIMAQQHEQKSGGP